MNRKKLLAVLTAVTMAASGMSLSVSAYDLSEPIAVEFVENEPIISEDNTLKYNGSALSYNVSNAVVSKTALSGRVTSNISNNNYTVWSKPVNSYLYESSDGTFTRVEYSNKSLTAELYSKDNKLISSSTLEMALPIFGGFYCGNEYNYLVFGQTNPNDSDSVEVMRAVKYTKDWKYVDALSVYGANTYIPFDAGSLRMTETNGLLYIYTCHEMYMSSDGYHHQANMTFVVNEEDMSLNQSYYGIMNISYGYVSHSFNEFIQTDGEYVYRVDHGDAYPRSVSITRCKVGGRITSVSYSHVLPIKIGATGNNPTGVELSKNNCIIVGNTIDQNNSSASYSDKRNIFVSVMSKDLKTNNMLQLTNYPADSDVTVRTPQLVKVDDDFFAVLWEEYNSTYKTTSVKAVTMDGSGNCYNNMELSSTRLSDCQPIVTSSQTIKWYVSDNLNVIMYEFDPFERPGHTHEFGEEWESDEISHWHKCSCGKRSVKELHTPDHGTLTTEPTMTTEGYVQFQCTTCGNQMLTLTVPPLSAEEDNISRFVERLYKNILNRDSDIVGKAIHIYNLKKGQTACKVAYDFVFSKEFLELDISNEERINRMYLTFLNREADPAGLADWTSVLDNGCSMGHIFHGFTQSNEFIEICAEYGINRGTWEPTENRDKSSKLTAFVARLYTKAMGRPYDVNGLNDHTGSYLENRDLYQLAHNFIFSKEFIEKNLSDEEFVDTMYHTFFDREPDPAGKAGWLDEMKNGMSRENVLAGFVGSQECADLVARFGI